MSRRFVPIPTKIPHSKDQKRQPKNVTVAGKRSISKEKQTQSSYFIHVDLNNNKWENKYDFITSKIDLSHNTLMKTYSFKRSEQVFFLNSMNQLKLDKTLNRGCPLDIDCYLPQ